MFDSLCLHWKSALLALPALFMCLPTTAQVFEDVTFDCTGALSTVVETPEGIRATGLVNITADLPNGAEWDSAGVIVIALPSGAAGRDVDGIPLRRCQGRGTLEIQQTGVLKGVDIFEFRIAPSDIRVRVGNRRISDPGRVGFSTTASGSPNV